MIGLGVGIDYALFIVSRYREGLHDGRSPRDATVAAMESAGRAVVFAGTTVMISMLGLLLVGIGWIGGMGIGVSATVLATMLTSTTLLPALLGFARERVELTRWRGLIAAGFTAAALLGLGHRVRAAGRRSAAPSPSLTLLASLAVRPLRRAVPRRVAKPVTRHLRLPVEPHHPAPPAAVADRGDRRCCSSWPRRSPSMRLGWADEGNFPEDTDDPPGLRPAGRGLRRRVQRPVHDHRRARRRRLGRDRRSACTRALEQTAGVAAVTAPDRRRPDAAGAPT